MTASWNKDHHTGQMYKSFELGVDNTTDLREHITNWTTIAEAEGAMSQRWDLQVTFYRSMNEVELQAEEAEKKADQAANENYERRQYERLKAKFEGR